MEIFLKEHNKETFENICELFKNYNRVAVEQATGTGKSYVTVKSIAHFSTKKTLYLTSGRKIIDEFKASTDLSTVVDMDKIDFMTYQGLLNTDIDMLKNKYDFIILDEYHRAGAKEWFVAVNNLLDAFKNTKVLGTTGTPIRYLDARRNMTNEIFDGVVANRITLSDAIEKSILKKPKYVLGMYDYTINKKIEKLSKKKEVLDKIKYITNNLDSLYGIPNILKKHIRNERKFIIFCESTAHLEMMQPIVFRWFKEAFKQKLNMYSIHSNKDDNNSDYEAFKADNGDKFSLLFVVNMLNEGVHIPVDGLFFLRGTRSAIIYYQQLGRALTTSNNNIPLIFDFVRNTHNILSSEYDNEDSLSKDGGYNGDRNLDYSINGYFDIYDETLDFKATLEEISIHISGWREKYDKMVEFKNKYGHLDIPKEQSSLYRFQNLQKKKYSEGKLSNKKIELLNAIGIEWNYIKNRNEVQWQNRLREIREFKNEHGHLDVPRSNTSLYKFLSKQRNLYLKGELIESRITDLINEGVCLTSKNQDIRLNNNSKSQASDNTKPNRSLWEIRFEELEDYKNQNGNCNVPRNYINKKLSEWVHTQRKNKDTLSLERKSRLTQLGFEFDLAKVSNENAWNEMLEQLIDFKRKFGHCKVPSNYHNTKLYNWVRSQKKAFKSEKLDVNRYNKLMEIDFIF